MFYWRRIFMALMKLTLEQAQQLIDDYLLYKYTFKFLSEKYKISTSLTRKVVNGESYPEAKRPENIKEIITKTTEEYYNKKRILTDQQVQQLIDDYV